jgi:hypothetical protein
LIEAVYKQEYQDDFLVDCERFTYDRIINRILSVDAESRFGRIMSERIGDINKFKDIKDIKQRNEMRRNAKKQRTEFRKKILKIKKNTPKVDDLNISQYYD